MKIISKIFFLMLAVLVINITACIIGGTGTGIGTGTETETGSETEPGNEIGNENGTGNETGNENGNENGNSENENNNGSNNNIIVPGGLYAKALPILGSDTPINLENTAGDTIIEKSISYINDNSGIYTLVIDSDVEVDGANLYEDNSNTRHLKANNAKLTIIGDNTERKIILNSALSIGGRIFTVGDTDKTGITLTIGNNITLDGNDITATELVYVQDNATFNMQDNSKITGCGLLGTGVWVTRNSAINLKDTALITDNNCGYIVLVLNGSTIIMQNNASISGNTGMLQVREYIGSEGSSG